jgi:NADH-quinone oxidoreductase subunit G
MPTAIVNNQPVEIGAEERLNCIEAAARIGFEIPSYCWHPALSVVASCRMCLVEIGQQKADGTVVMEPKLVPGCQQQVKDGTVVVANSEKVRAAQKATLEYLLLNHPLDCPTCDQAGECLLQDFSYRYGRGYSRLQEPKNIKPDKDHIGDQITLFTDRCIMCSRCVRFTREISGTGELMVVGRGTHEEIDIFPGQPVNNKLAGNVVDICPVGALCSKDFLYKQRVWWLKSANSVCPDCSTGCSIHVDQNDDRVYRLRPRENPQAQGHFMCDEGRFGWKYIHAEERLGMPEQRDAGGRVVSRDWDVVLVAVRSALEAAARDRKIAAVLSPWMTLEDAYMLAGYVKSLSAEATLALGPVRVVGRDDKYPKDVHGQPVEPAKFTIRAEKCPNRRGVELVLNHFGGASVATLGDVLGRAAHGEFGAIYLVGGDPHGWITDDQAHALGGVPTVVVQDIFPSPASQKASFVLAGGAFAERDGTFINHAGLAQEIRRAVRGPIEARPDGRILWELTGRRGLFNMAALRREMAEAIPALAALGDGVLGEQGIRLATDGAAALA